MPQGYRPIIRGHVYDKCWLLDITWAELEQLLEDEGEVVEETPTSLAGPNRSSWSADGTAHYTSSWW